MKLVTRLLTLAAVVAFGSAIVLPYAGASAQTARVQVIHNAPDSAAAVVDVYLDADLLLDNFGFGEATPFVDAPAGSEIVLGIAPAASDSVDDVIATFPVTLTDGETYVVVASGVLDPARFAANPDGRPIGFTLLVRDGAREASLDPSKVEFVGVHGITDAGMLDVLGPDGPLADDAGYGDATPYVALDDTTISVTVTPADDNGTALWTAEVDLNGLAGTSAVVLASGFLDPGTNENGPAAQVLAVFADGSVLAYPLVVNGGDDDYGDDDADGCFFGHGYWKNHTEAWPDGVHPDDPFFDSGISWIEVLSLPSRGGNAYIILGRQYAAAYLNILSGAGGGGSDVPDAVNEAADLLAAWTYDDPPGRADRTRFTRLSGLLGSFSREQRACSDIGVEPDTMAYVQVIHSAADPGLDSVDVYLGDTLILDGFAFRTATPFVALPPDSLLTIGLAPDSSASVDDVVASFDVILEAGRYYAAIASGVLDTTQFAPNPDGLNTSLSLLIVDEVWAHADSAASPASDVFVSAAHAVTDAPAVDVVVRDVGVLFGDLAYGDVAGFVAVGAGTYPLDVAPAGDTTTVLASYEADLTGLEGQSVVVVASGFLEPGANQDGAAFALIGVLADGTVVELPVIDGPSGKISGAVGIESLGRAAGEFALRPAYPNPFVASARFEVGIPRAGDLRVTVFDALGRRVRVLYDGEIGAGAYELTLDGARLPSGAYFLRAEFDGEARVGGVVLAR